MKFGAKLFDLRVDASIAENKIFLMPTTFTAEEQGLFDGIWTTDFASAPCTTNGQQSSLPMKRRAYSAIGLKSAGVRLGMIDLGESTEKSPSIPTKT